MKIVQRNDQLLYKSSQITHSTIYIECIYIDIENDVLYIYGIYKLEVTLICQYLGWRGGRRVASALLVEVAIEPIQVSVTAPKMDIGRPPAQKMPQ